MSDYGIDLKGLVWTVLAFGVVTGVGVGYLIPWLLHHVHLSFR